MAPDCAYFTDTETYSNLNIVKLLFKVKENGTADTEYKQALFLSDLIFVGSR